MRNNRHNLRRLRNTQRQKLIDSGLLIPHPETQKERKKIEKMYERELGLDQESTTDKSLE